MSSEVTVGKGKGFLNPQFKISTDVGQSCWPYPKHRSQHQNRSLDDTASQSWCVIPTFSDATLKASRIKSPCFLFAKVLQGKWTKAMTTMTWSRILTFIYDLSPFAHLFGSSFPLGDGLWFPAYHLMPCSWYEGAVFFKLPANVSEVQGIKSKRAYLHGPQNQCNACQKSGLNFWGLWSTVLSPYVLLWDPCTSSKVRLASIQVSSKTRLTSWINKHFKAGHAHVSHQPSMPYKMLDVWTLQSSTCLESSSLLQITGILASPLGVFSWLLAHQRPLLSSRVRAVTPVIQKGQHLWTQRGLRYCFFPVPEKGTGKAIVVEAVIS